MTHDELLSKVDDLAVHNAGYGAISEALRAVLELHRPVMAWTGAYDYNDAELWAEQCDYCSSNGFSQTYPCRNIQAIEKELG